MSLYDSNAIVEGSDTFVVTKFVKYPGLVAAVNRSTGIMLPDIVVMITFQIVLSFFDVKDKWAPAWMFPRTASSIPSFVPELLVENTAS